MSKEVLEEVKTMAENAIQASKMTVLSAEIHKEGLVATLKDIVDYIEENK